MTASAYMPDVRVEIAFDSGVRTPAVDRMWTDVSAYVEFDREISITRGRPDELAVTSPSTLALTLDNSDGRFTPGLASSPYYPNVKLGRPIRVVAETSTGDSVRFTGYVDTWPVEWSGAVDSWAEANVTATSRLARLGEGAELRSIIEEEIMLDNPVAYYPLGEPEGSLFARDLSGNDTIGMYSYYGGTGIEFGTGIGPRTDGLPAARIDPTITGSGDQSDALAAYFDRPLTAVTIEVFATFNGRNSTEAAQMVTLWNRLGGDERYYLQVTGAGGPTPVIVGGYSEQIGVSLGLLAAFGAGDAVDDAFSGGVHHYAVSYVPGATPSLKLYYDGVLTGTTSAPLIGSIGTTMPAFHYFMLGPFTVAGPKEEPATFAHAAVYDTALSDARIAAHAAAGLTGFAGETAMDRLERYAGYADLDPTEVDSDAGALALSHIDTTNATVEGLLRIVESSEGGVLFDGRDGNLVFRDRTHRYQATADFTINVGAQEVEAGGLRPQLDRSTLVNSVTSKSLDGTIEARFEDTSAADDYGLRRADVTIASTDPVEVFQAAAALVNRYKEPRSRIGALAPIDVLQFDYAPTRDAIIEADIGSRFAVTNFPNQAESTDADFFIEGITETLGLEAWRFEFNASPAGIFDAWILDDATHSQLGTTTTLAY